MSHMSKIKNKQVRIGFWLYIHNLRVEHVSEAYPNVSDTDSSLEMENLCFIASLLVYGRK